jgi:hypothetical protein
MSQSPVSSPEHQASQALQAPKRKASQAGIDGIPVGRSVKRRASKACQCCRARKVRCNVTEHGAPCTNCRLDEVDCIVSESRRKRSVASGPISNGFLSGSFPIYRPNSLCNVMSSREDRRQGPDVQTNAATCHRYLYQISHRPPT